MAGHGWVVANPDGMKARCGGPKLCKQCALEAAQFAARHTPVMMSEASRIALVNEVVNKLLDDLRTGIISKIDIAIIEERCRVALLDYQTDAATRERLIQDTTRKVVERASGLRQS